MSEVKGEDLSPPEQEKSFYNCPRCSEKMLRTLGNLLVCPTCDIVLVEPVD
ncbi:MAG: hypothetical protein KGI08_07100 [Thaumarchaeota archaeon]|nr:hypothetical protein [Nitrososphaerota archaeon]